MNGLIQLSCEAFTEQQFNSFSGLYDALEICAFEKGEALAQKRAVGPSALVEWMSHDSSSGHDTAVTASIKLVCVNRDLGGRLYIAPRLFDELYYAMGADPSLLYMIKREYDGFHEFHNPGYTLTRFLGTPLYALVWTFDYSTCTTRCLFIRRLWDPFPNFCRIVELYRDQIYASQLLAFVSVVFLLHWFDSQTSERELSAIQTVEQATGFGPKRGREDQVGLRRFDINQLTTWSQVVNETAGNMTNKLRHQACSSTLLTMIAQEHRSLAMPAALELGFSSAPVAHEYLRSTATLAEAIPYLEKQMAVYAEFLAYLKDRSQRLSSVLFALLTHEDAEASVNLARESKRDSSSMKTIAVVTMAFLPGTFYAALFALPSLRWNEEQVVGDNFWVYWAFTLPSTLLVFIMWLYITQRSWIMATLRSRTKKYVAKKEA